MMMVLVVVLVVAQKCIGCRRHCERSISRRKRANKTVLESNFQNISLFRKRYIIIFLLSDSKILYNSSKNIRIYKALIKLPRHNPLHSIPLHSTPLHSTKLYKTILYNAILPSPLLPSATPQARTQRGRAARHAARKRQSPQMRPGRRQQRHQIQRGAKRRDERADQQTKSVRTVVETCE